MQDKGKVIMGFGSVILALVFVCQPSAAFAREGHRGHDDASRFSVNFKHGSVSLGFGRELFYPRTREFYQPYRTEYIMIRQPSGALVYSLPYYQQISINGVMYYTYNGVYYLPQGEGYQVVQPPVHLMAQPAPVPVPVPVPTVAVSTQPDEEQTFTLNIPLLQGNGYKTVIIKRDGQGFQGPQGEFYAEFPSVQQLKVMYGK